MESDALTSLERITYEAFQVYPAVKLTASAFEAADLHTSYGPKGPTTTLEAPDPLRLNGLIQQCCSSTSIHLNPLRELSNIPSASAPP